MSQEMIVERFFETLITGDRGASNQVVRECVDQGVTASRLVTHLFWPAYEMMEKLYRGDQITKLTHHLASRLLRVLVDQNAARMAQTRQHGDGTPRPGVGQRIFALCGPRDSDELGAQMAVDLLEEAGFTVKFAGGGIANDEILAHVHEEQPDILLMFASGANDLPNIRQMIDTLKEIGACNSLKIAVGGGVFNRAEGLAEEIGVHEWAKSPLEMVDILTGKAASVPCETVVPIGTKRRRPTTGLRREAA